MRCLLPAWRAFEALALNRSTNCWWWEISFSRLEISFSLRLANSSPGLQSTGEIHESCIIIFPISAD